MTDDFIIATADICPHGGSSSLCEWCGYKAQVELLANNAKPVIDVAIADRDYWMNEAERLRAEVEHTKHEIRRVTMAKFETGDKVVCIRDSDDGSFFGHPGETFTVSTCYEDDLMFGEMPVGETAVDANRFELIEEKSTNGHYVLSNEDFDRLVSDFKSDDQKESDLEFLIRVSNLGMRAENLLLTEYFAQVERRSNTKDSWCSFTQNPYTGYSVYRVKPKPVFQPFYVDGLLVRLEGNTLHIGDYEFDSMELRDSLSDLVRDSVEVAYVSGVRLGCMRNGVCIAGKRQISWSSAEQILTAFEGL